MCFLLYSDVDKHILKFVKINVTDETEEKYSVHLCAENKTLRIASKKGYQDITFNTYDELLFTIVLIGKKLYAETMIEKLDNFEYEIRHDGLVLPLMTTGREIGQLIANIRRIREDYANYNFRLMIQLGRLEDEYINSLLNQNSTLKYTIDKFKEHAKELCYKSDDPNVRYWCDTYEPGVRAVVYAVPEDKRIITVFEVDDVIEAYRQEVGYNTAEEFFKALDNVVDKCW